jgi:hypothetical protein
VESSFPYRRGNRNPSGGGATRSSGRTAPPPGRPVRPPPKQRPGDAKDAAESDRTALAKPVLAYLALHRDSGVGEAGRAGRPQRKKAAASRPRGGMNGSPGSRSFTPPNPEAPPASSPGPRKGGGGPSSLLSRPAPQPGAGRLEIFRRQAPRGPAEEGRQGRETGVGGASLFQWRRSRPPSKRRAGALPSSRPPPAPTGFRRKQSGPESPALPPGRDKAPDVRGSGESGRLLTSASPARVVSGSPSARKAAPPPCRPRTVARTSHRGRRRARPGLGFGPGPPSGLGSGAPCVPFSPAALPRRQAAPPDRGGGAGAHPHARVPTRAPYPA